MKNYVNSALKSMQLNLSLINFRFSAFLSTKGFLSSRAKCASSLGASSASARRTTARCGCMIDRLPGARFKAYLAYRRRPTRLGVFMVNFTDRALESLKALATRLDKDHPEAAGSLREGGYPRSRS